MKNSKFYKPTPFKERLIDFLQSLLFWRGRRKGIIHTMTITLSDIRKVFIPLNFNEKYKYLGVVPWDEKGDIFQVLEPLIIFMDHKAKPWWCPRWFLRFLHLFGSDNSIVRVRNFTLHNLGRKLTKGLIMWDYKTKWSHYDLRISISGTKEMQNLADDIEHGFYSRGRQTELVDQIKKLDPQASIIWGSIPRLEKQLKKLEHENAKRTYNTDN